MESRKIIITGGNGFIGSRIVRKLIENGDTPILLHRSLSDMWRIKDVLNYIKLYNLDKITIKEVFEKDEIYAIVNLATHYNKMDSLEDQDKMIEANIKLPMYLLELSKLNGAKTFVTAGSYFQYKNCKILDEETTLVGRNLYASTKNALERIMDYYKSTTNMNVVSLIIFTPYGEMDHPERLIPYIIKKGLSKKLIDLSYGFQKLSPVYVEDIADAFMRTLDVPINNNIMRINIANNKSYSIREITSIIEELLGYRLKVKWGTFKAPDIDVVDDMITNGDLAEKILGWHPKYDIYKGLEKTIDYYRSSMDGC